MKRTHCLACLLALLLTVSCSSPLERQATERLAKLTEAGALSTSEFTVTKILKANDYSWWKIGERKILISCKAFLEAGVDMTKYDPSRTHINAESGTIHMVLPPVELLSVNMPADQIEVAYEHVTGIRAVFSPEDKNNILRQGEADIRADVPNLGILELAEANTVSFFKSMFEELGFENITIEFE